MYIVKGKIRKFSLYGNNQLLRSGSPHFFPDTEVILCHYYKSEYRIDPKLWVRGTHRSGLYKTRVVRAKYLIALKLEEVQSPSQQTLDFIKRNGIRLIGNPRNNDSDLSDVRKMLDFFEEIEEPEILSGVVDDDLFIKARSYVLALQNSIRESINDAKRINTYFQDLIEVKSRFSSKLTHLSKGEFFQKYERYFTERVSQTILRTDVNTIFPTEDRMIIGLVEVQIKADGQFKISRVEVND